jgi:hypothetical protein
MGQAPASAVDTGAPVEWWVLTDHLLARSKTANATNPRAA